MDSIIHVHVDMHTFFLERLDVLGGMQWVIRVRVRCQISAVFEVFEAVHGL